MKQYSDSAPVELSFDEVSTITHALTLIVEQLIQRDARPILVENFIEVAKKLNDVLKSNEFNHYTDDKFEFFEKYVKTYTEKGG